MCDFIKEKKVIFDDRTNGYLNFSRHGQGCHVSHIIKNYQSKRHLFLVQIFGFRKLSNQCQNLSLSKQIVRIYNKS
ncbi:CLUMA_CG014063, isoform A [Clunio marinus]|uniref:CLUMA_CG014063, isoform A n=1 Tax=Clunio marinus TaxID=568069 RepID=A0A1J1IMN0_9DIPT|nr:CLUMA_CG014063, isoform A [Clunio marinus]